MTYYNEQDLRDELTDILLEECRHKNTVKEDATAFCITCEAYAPWWRHGDEDEYGDWEHRPEIYDHVTTDELIERAKEAKKL